MSQLSEFWSRTASQNNLGYDNIDLKFCIQREHDLENKQ